MTKVLPTGIGPFFSVVDPTGAFLYVSNAKDTTVSVVDLIDQTMLEPIQGVGNQPFALTFD